MSKASKNRALSRPPARRRRPGGGRWGWLPRWVKVAGASVALGALIGGAGFLIWRAKQGEPPRTDWVDRRPLVVVDAGHGGVDGGTQGFGVLEKRVALATAIRTSRELVRRGLRAVLTREGDEMLSLDERVRIANEQEADAVVSVHFNFTTASAAVRGVETFYSDPKDLSAQSALARILRVPGDAPEIARTSTALADAIRSGIVARAETADRGTRNRPELAITRRTHAPAVLVECAYLSNRTDAGRAATPEWQTKLAEGIADGVETWLADHSTPKPDQ